MPLFAHSIIYIVVIINRFFFVMQRNGGNCVIQSPNIVYKNEHVSLNVRRILWNVGEYWRSDQFLNRYQWNLVSK